MRYLFSGFLLLQCWALSAQVFMRAFDPAPALGLGGATVAAPGLGQGINNEAALGLAAHPFGLLAGSVLPFGIGEWQTAAFQAHVRSGEHAGFGLSIDHSGIETYSEQSLRLSYGRRLGEKFLLGGSAQLLRSVVPEYANHTTATFSLAMLAQPIPNLWLGARVQNPFQQYLDNSLLPTVIRFGASWKVSPLLLLLAEAAKDLERPTQVKAGMEYRPVERLFIRAGVRTNPGRYCLGFGLHLKNGLSLDVASEWHPVLGITPAAGLGWNMGN